MKKISFLIALLCSLNAYSQVGLDTISNNESGSSVRHSLNTAIRLLDTIPVMIGDSTQHAIDSSKEYTDNEINNIDTLYDVDIMDSLHVLEIVLKNDPIWPSMRINAHNRNSGLKWITQEEDIVDGGGMGSISYILDTNNTLLSLGIISFLSRISGSDYGGEIRFATRHFGGGYGFRLIIKEDGKIGINEVNPDVGFEVNRNTKIDSNLVVIGNITGYDTLFFNSDTITNITVHNVDSVSITINGNIYKMYKVSVATSSGISYVEVKDTIQKDTLDIMYLDTIVYNLEQGSDTVVIVGIWDNEKSGYRYDTLTLSDISSLGYMNISTYDPQSIAGDAFARANHTGTQVASTISDFDTEVSNNTDVTANTAFRTTPSTVITAGTNLSWSGNTLNATGGSGSSVDTTLTGNDTVYFLRKYNYYTEYELYDSEDTIFIDTTGSHSNGIIEFDIYTLTTDTFIFTSQLPIRYMSAADTFDNTAYLHHYYKAELRYDRFINISLNEGRDTITILTGDITPPEFVSAEIGTFDDSIFVVIMDTNDLHQDSIIHTAFYITENGSEYGSDTAYIHYDSIFIAMDSAGLSGAAYLIDHTPTHPYLQDSSGNYVVAWVDSTVTNNITGGYGAELITNGTFNTDLTGWSGTTYWSWESDGGGGGRCRHSAGLGSIYQTILTPTVTYHIVFTIGGMTTGSIVARPGNTPGTTRTANGTYEEDIVCGGDALMRFTPTTDFDGYIDDISVKEVL